MHPLECCAVKKEINKRQTQQLFVEYQHSYMFRPHDVIIRLASEHFNKAVQIYFYSKTNQMHQCIKFILFRNDTLHVSDGLSVHHQQFKTAHTATGIWQTDTAVCLLASRQQYLFGCCMYSLELLMMDGKTVRNM